MYDINKIRIIKSARKTMSIEIHPDCSVIVRAPKYSDRAEIVRFIKDHEKWIEKHLTAMAEKSAQSTPPQKLTQKELEELAQKAAKVLPGIVLKYAKLLNVSFGRITVRNQHTRWGSCSSNGNLSFNCLLMLCPDDVIEYVVVHELCHRIEMNHSAQFWALVAGILPDYKLRDKWLKDHGAHIMAKNA